MCFLAVVLAAEHVDGIPAVAEGVTGLGDAVEVVSDEAVRRRDDLGRAAVVGFQSEGLHVGIVPLEVEDVFYPGAPEGVDGLGVVADGADVTPFGGEVVDDHVLDEIGVLVLVHEDVFVL